MGFVLEYAMILENVRIILVNPSHPGNIGAVARAMKNMGLSRLFLVAPEAFPHPEAIYRAVGAADILTQATVTPDLPQALLGCEFVYAASARSRRLEWPGCDARQCANRIVQNRSRQEVALVFGRESSGLTNEEIAHCHNHVYIPADEEFSSLNLAAAVQILAYELRMAWQAQVPEPAPAKIPRQLAPNEQIQGFYNHLETTLVQIEFLNPSHPKRLMQRLQRLFNRAQMDATEVNILRGILTAINRLTDSHS
jgi:tRNA (cytidine32/uridine32-2'-O)-methyltransferase